MLVRSATAGATRVGGSSAIRGRLAVLAPVPRVWPAVHEAMRGDDDERDPVAWAWANLPRLRARARRQPIAFVPDLLAFVVARAASEHDGVRRSLSSSWDLVSLEGALRRGALILPDAARTVTRMFVFERGRVTVRTATRGRA